MATEGKYEKMLILAFSDAEKAQSGGKSEAIGDYTVLINPESYSLDYKVEFGDTKQAEGTSGKQLKFKSILPPELSFEFLFDGTGLLGPLQTDKDNKKPKAEADKHSIAKEIKFFKDMILGFKGESHEPWLVKLVWGDGLIFIGRATEMSIAYKLFNASGMPIRALVKVRFKGSIEDRARTAQEKKQSPDLTHFRRVKAGDTLHLMCQRIYGDARYYLQVAEVNGLGNFRRLTPGTELLFPPIDKTNN